MTLTFLKVPFILFSSKPNLAHMYTVCIVNNILVFVKLCVTAVDLWGKTTLAFMYSAVYS
jgi:hypothetical protein